MLAYQYREFDNEAIWCDENIYALNSFIATLQSKHLIKNGKGGYVMYDYCNGEAKLFGSHDYL